MNNKELLKEITRLNKVIQVKDKKLLELSKILESFQKSVRGALQISLSKFLKP